MDLMKQFFSFDKLMKDRLVTAFFYLSMIAVVVMFLGALKYAFGTMGISGTKGIWFVFVALFQLLFSFITLRLIAELMIAIFHINDNVSPDGGHSEMADLDVIEAARDVAAKAAKSASAATKSVVEKTKSKISEVRDDRVDNEEDEIHEYEMEKPVVTTNSATKPKAKPAAKTTRKAPVKKTPAKTSAKKAPTKKTPTKKTTKAKTTSRKRSPTSPKSSSPKT